ncbi:Crp/Fnr family transcriptional regulator [Rhizobium jaguaris]|uniref:Crp/Fnr family transcriptional regulator n=1 Tax=Rhizobium jaguaris TaxID=1312183 RepID=UPI0039BF4308
MSVEFKSLARSKLFAGLGKSAAERLYEKCEILQFKAGEFILREAEEAKAFFSVVDGYVRLLKMDEFGTQTDLTVCEPNDIFAECMLAGGKLYGYSAQAAGDAVVARFDLEDVRRLADADRTIERAVMQLMAEHFLSAMDCIAGDRSQTASQRLANYLLSRCTLQATSQIIELPFQKRLLAGKLGLAPEALSRAFATLRCAGVSVHGKTIRIDDVTALRRV